MSENVRQFNWNAQRETAARLVADGQLTEAQIAAQIGVTDRQLRRWKEYSIFTDRVQEHVAAQRGALKAEGIANKQNRIDTYNALLEKLQTVIVARAEEHAEVPGGSTGLLVRTARLVKVYNAAGESEDGETLYSAKRDVPVYEYAVDTPLLKELRAVMEQAAKELGQWVEKRDDTLNAGDSFIQALREFGRGTGS